MRGSCAKPVIRAPVKLFGCCVMHGNVPQNREVELEQLIKSWRDGEGGAQTQRHTLYGETTIGETTIKNARMANASGSVMTESKELVACSAKMLSIVVLVRL